MARILITRAPHQASDLADRLRALGHEPILIPTIEIVPPSSFAPLDAALELLVTPGPPKFHWLLFTSANAVEAFEARVKNAFKALVDQIIPLNYALKIAVVGPATASAMASIGLKSTLTAPQQTAQSLASALTPHALQPDGTPTRMLFICSEIARENLVETLRAAGAQVTVAPAYTTRIPARSIPQLQNLFVSPQNHPAAITFTSSSTATNLLAALEVSGLRLPPEIPRISIGPVTSQTLRDAGFPPIAEAAEPTLSALIDVLTPLLSVRPGQG